MSGIDNSYWACGCAHLGIDHGSTPQPAPVVFSGPCGRSDCPCTAFTEVVQIVQTLRDDAWAAVCADTDDARSWDEMNAVCRVENALRAHAGLPFETPQKDEEPS